MSKNSYKSIAKANILFGGVQIYNILISVLRSKAIALLLGPEGMGIMGLFNSTLDLVKSATNMGLQTSAVREVSIAKNTRDYGKIQEIKTVLSKLVWITGLLGVLFTFIFAPYLSKFAFGNESYILHFRILSITLLIYQLTVEHNVILQGMRELKLLAKANVIGSTLGLILILPIFYLKGLDAIVPSIIMTALITYIAVYYLSRNIKIKSLNIGIKDFVIKGKSMVIMGFMLSLTGFMDVIVSYLVKIAITNWGSVSEVGLYNAGYSIVLSYVGLVFSSIGTDYFPRLSATANDLQQCNLIINKQFALMILVLTPLILFFIAFAPFLLKLLYSSEFVSVSSMICWLVAGMIFRAIAWCPGFMYIVKNDTRLYLLIYIFTILIELSLFITFYYLYGLIGLGISFFIVNVLCALSSILITKWRYNCTYSFVSYKLMIYSIILTFAILGVSLIDSMLKYYLYCFLLLISIIYSWRGLNERLGISLYLKNKFLK